MQKSLVQIGKLSLGDTVGPAPLSLLIIAALGLSFLIAEGVLLKAQGIDGIVYPLIAIFAASIISSIAGSAFTALCGALLFHVMDSPVYAVQVMIVCSIAIQLLSIAALRRAIEWRSLGVFLLGGCLGAPAGVYLLLHLPMGTYRVLIGGPLIVYCAYLLPRQPIRLLLMRPLCDACAGFLCGITGGLAGFPGASVAIWCGLKGWDKGRQRGVFQPFILVMQLATLLTIYLMRPSLLAQVQLDWKVFTFVPAALLGAWFGLRIFKWLSDRQSEHGVNALLILSAVGLIL